MRIGYTWLKKPAIRHMPQFLLGIGLIAVPLTVRLENAELAKIPRPAAPAVPGVGVTKTDRDARTVRLRQFFAKLHCPVQDLAGDFIRAADANHLDWRLLPSISVIESGGGKAYRNNNIFGWDNGEQQFFSVRDSIPVIASRLGRSRLYRHRNLESLLHIYNPENDDYAENVMSVMERIGPANTPAIRQDLTRN